MSIDRFEGGPIRDLSERRLGSVVYAALLALVVLAASGAIGLALKLPWLFPSLGPTVMLFFESPAQRSSRPLNALVGHLVGLLVGWGSFTVLGLSSPPSAPVGGLTPQYLIAGALSVAVTSAILTAIRLPHPPAGATTLIVSLGILTTPPQLASMAGAILLVTLLGWAANRLFLGRRRT